MLIRALSEVCSLQGVLELKLKGDLLMVIIHMASCIKFQS